MCVGGGGDILQRSMNSKRNSGGALAGSTALRNLKANPSLARKLELLDAEDKRINTVRQPTILLLPDCWAHLSASLSACLHACRTLLDYLSDLNSNRYPTNLSALRVKALAYKERKKKLLSANADVMDIASAASGLI